METTPNKNPFIFQTALDYDMPYDQVERMYKLYPEKFYEKLEEYIKQRASSNNPKQTNL